MTITAKVIADSVHHHRRRTHRITTFECIYPRFVHSEVLTHRMLSRNTASSRAIPVERVLEAVERDPAMPVYWGRNRPGMQATEEMDAADIEVAKAEWLAARDSAVAHVRRLLALGLHKQATNRLLEPYLHVTSLITATDWANYYALRDHEAAQPEFRVLAHAMRLAQQASAPVDRTFGEGIDAWHLPLVTDEERAVLGAEALRVCVARCARVSYTAHNGKRDIAADIELHDRLYASGHLSPFEHAAMPLADGSRSGNFVGWLQLRKTLAGEHPYQPGQVEP